MTPKSAHLPSRDRTATTAAFALLPRPLQPRPHCHHCRLRTAAKTTAAAAALPPLPPSHCCQDHSSHDHCRLRTAAKPRPHCHNCRLRTAAKTTAAAAAAGQLNQSDQKPKFIAVIIEVGWFLNRSDLFRWQRPATEISVSRFGSR